MYYFINLITSLRQKPTPQQPYLLNAKYLNQFSRIVVHYWHMSLACLGTNNQAIKNEGMEEGMIVWVVQYPLLVASSLAAQTW